MWFDIHLWANPHCQRKESKEKNDLSLPVCAVSWSEVSFLLCRHFWVNHRGIMKTYLPVQVWLIQLIDFMIFRKKSLLNPSENSAYKNILKYWNNILSYFTIHTQYRHTHLHQIWEKLSKYKQALIDTLNHIDTHIWKRFKNILIKLPP